MNVVKWIALTGLTAASSLLVAAAPASAGNNSNVAQPRPSASGAGQAQRGDDPDRTICVQDRLTGSRISRRVCKTAREWQAEGGLPTDDR